MKGNRVFNGGAVCPLTFEERKRIEEFAYKKISGNEIAGAIGRSKTAVNSEFRRAGGRVGYTAEKGQRAYEASCAQRGVNSLRDLPDELREEFIRVHEEKKSCKEIRRIFGICHSTYCNWRKAAGLPPLSLVSLAEELDQRLFVVEEQLKILTQILEAK